MQEGVKGTERVTANVSYINGIETRRKVIERVTIEEPTTEIISMGTKAKPAGVTANIPDNMPIGQFLWPVGGDGGQISEMMYGYGGYYGHKGIDITAERGTPVLAAADGKVYTAEWTVGYGKCVMIDHDGYVTVYGHLDDIYVSDGEKVNRGDAIGTIGSTGYITGTALHFEVRFGDTDEYVCINPLSMLPEHARTSYCIEES